MWRPYGSSKGRPRSQKRREATSGRIGAFEIPKLLPVDPQNHFPLSFRFLPFLRGKLVVTATLDESAQLYAKHLPSARALHPEDVVPYRIDAAVALANVRLAMPLILAKKHLLAEHLPKVDEAMLIALPEIALATEYAAKQAENARPADKLLGPKLAEGWQLRALLLEAARMLASAGLVHQEDVDSIAAGRGQRDMAQDCLALAELFQRHESAIVGKHPIDPLQIQEAAAVGTWLLANLRASKTPAEEVDIRDRMGSLLLQQFQILGKVAHYFYGKHWETLIPSLQAPIAKRSTESTESEG